LANRDNNVESCGGIRTKRNKKSIEGEVEKSKKNGTM
jgi:hypothetical protein